MEWHKTYLELLQLQTYDIIQNKNMVKNSSSRTVVINIKKDSLL
jgi:hypothetical protein